MMCLLALAWVPTLLSGEPFCERETADFVWAKSRGIFGRCGELRYLLMLALV